jgi:choline dehydrogenase
MPPQDTPTFDYVVVGSGAGGGPVAANLASADFKVLLIEAGYDYQSLNVSVPGLHGQSTEDPEMRWDFWVRHYQDINQQKLDTKYFEFYPAGPPPGERVDGVLYPRAGTLGGCTAHNAMITVYPHESDWEGMAAITGDASWKPENMRRYFERLESCAYRDPATTAARHGFSGWLGTSMADISLALGDSQLLQVVGGAVAETYFELLVNSLGDPLSAIEQFLKANPSLTGLLQSALLQGGDLKGAFKDALMSGLDPNDYRVTLSGREGVFLVPLAVKAGVRNGTRERLLRVQEAFPDNLTILYDAVVTRVLFKGTRAVGVEYVEGRGLYRAAPVPDGGRPQPGPPKQARASREVVLSGGAFNTPQVLMLSGVGPKAQLDKLGINVVLDRPAVGQFLQDRYEVAVISEMPDDFSVLQDCRFRLPNPGEEPDSVLKQWEADHTGLLATNGAVVAIIRRSSPQKADPDLFIFGLPARFKGYFPNYADALVETRNEFTWAILKAHTQNRKGSFNLRSTDPFERPEINFHYFQEGSDAAADDLRSVVEGVKFVRSFTDKLGLASRLMTNKPLQPAPDIQNDDDIGQWVKNEAWGHHACGTCRIGPPSDVQNSVLDTDFKVKGADGLRVVDASVFPSIPGFFIVTPIYMIAEKASEVILRDAGAALPSVT